MIIKNKKAAMEMSVGTIVTIVLLMSVLILGIFLVQNIFKSAKGAVDLTDEQLKNEINKLFAEDKKLAVYPGNRLVEIKQEEVDGVGIGIKNLLKGAEGTKTFSYEVILADSSNCGANSESAVSKWIKTGRTESGIPIPVGDLSIQKVTFEIPTGTPLCIARFRINVNTEGAAYATEFFDISVQPK